MRIISIAAVALALGAGVLAAPPAQAHAPGSRGECVIIDNDLDIDDFMAIPLVMGNRRVAAIVQTEGVALPEQAAPVVDRAFNHGVSGRRGEKVPVIAGGSQAQSPDLSRWPWLPFFRSMMNRGNGLLTSVPAPWPSDPQYAQRVAASVKGCRSVSLLVLGPYTSLIAYLPLIADKVDRVVVMGQDLFDESRTPGRESFNCRFDLASCRTAMPMLKGLSTFFVDIPDFSDCTGTTTWPAHCYSPDYAMVAGLSHRGLAGRMRKGLLNDIDCSSLYTTPGTVGNPCSSQSTWNPPDVAAGPGGEMLLWDQSAALMLLRPQMFSLYYPPEHPELGGKHYEPTLVDGSDAKTVQKLRAMWTGLMNRGSR